MKYIYLLPIILFSCSDQKEKDRQLIEFNEKLPMEIQDTKNGNDIRVVTIFLNCSEKPNNSIYIILDFITLYPIKETTNNPNAIQP